MAGLMQGRGFAKNPVVKAQVAEDYHAYMSHRQFKKGKKKALQKKG